MASNVLPPKDRKGFEIAIICALRSEADAVEALFDDYWDEEGDAYGKAPGDTNAYTTGVIGRHNVVLAYIPSVGKASAASAAASFRSSFGGIKLALVVGICGGVPTGKNDEEILLGDIIISTGILQYDFGRLLYEFVGKNTLEDNLGRPNTEIRAFLSRLEGLRGRKRLEANTVIFLEQLCQQADFQKARYPGIIEDKLYKRTYRHRHRDLPRCLKCADCKRKKGNVCNDALNSSCTELKCSEIMLVQRRRLVQGEAAEKKKPVVHFGKIASGDTVMKSGEDRDLIAAKENIIGFEMEGAGVWDQFPCVVIKGVCDYADSHKNKKWQGYAALTASACMKAFLKEWVPTEDLSSKPAFLEPKPQWLVPFGQNANFVGREDQLKAVLDKLAPDDYLKTCQRIAITGLGGIGKTQIALEAAFQIREQHPDCSVFWVSAVNSTSFEAAYRRIAQELQIVGINDDKADFKMLVKTYLSQDSAGRWLLIVDNADDLEMLYRRTNESGEASGSLALADYLPFSRQGSILFTSRNYEAAVYQAGVDVVTVKEMSESDSLRLLETILIDKTSFKRKDDALELLRHLSYLPLAIKQAAAFINQKQMSISDYLDICMSNDEELIRLLSKDFEDQERYRNIRNPIALTWFISFAQIEKSDRLAAELLYFMSFVAQKDIPYSLLPSASKSKEAIGTLKAYGFISSCKGGNSYDIHRLVQITVRNWLKTTGELTKWGSGTLKHISGKFPFYKHENREKCTLYIPHVQCILSFQDILGDIKDPLRDLVHNAGEYFLETGKYTEAEKMYRQAIDLRKDDLNDDNQSTTLDSMNNLATVFCEQGRYVEAEILQKQTLELKKDTLGDNHPSTLSSMNNLAILFRQQGKYTQAEILQKQTLEMKRVILGDNHLSTLDSMNNLATVFGEQGKYVEAAILQQQTLELKRSTIGKDHPSTLNSMNNLAIVFRQQGKYAEAEILQQQTLRLKKGTLGENHPSTLNSMNNLAEVFQQQGKFMEAEILQKQTLKLKKDILGDNHPSTLSSMNNLAIVFRQQGKYAKAKILQQQTLEMKRGTLGDNHPSTVSSMKNLATVFQQQGKYAEVEKLQQKILKLKR